MKIQANEISPQTVFFKFHLPCANRNENKWEMQKNVKADKRGDLIMRINYKNESMLTWIDDILQKLQ